MKWHPAYAFILVALALLTSINSLENGFAYDDQNQILNNEFIRDINNLPLAFTSSVWAFLNHSVWNSDNYFRPLFTNLCTINYAIFGTTAWGWHLVNVLIHAGVTYFVFAICKELTGRHWVAVAAAAFFAVHPIHAESVAWVSGVTDPLMGLFLLPAFYCYLRYKNSGRRHLIAAALGLYLLALLTKETALVFPAMIAYCEIGLYKDSASLRRRLAGVAALVGLFAVPTLIYFLLRYQALGTFLAGGKSTGLIDPVLLTAPLVAAKELWLLVWPIGYNLHHYTTPVSSMASWAFLGPLILFVVLAVLIALIRCRVLWFAAIWFVVFLAPPLASLHLFYPLQYVQERYLYLPSVGFCLAVALAIEWLASRKPLGVSARVTALAVTAVLLIVWSTVLIRQNEVWHDSIAVFQRSVSVHPDSGAARSALSTAYFTANDFRSAEEAARTAIERDPTYLDSYQNLSLYMDVAGRTPEAIQILERAKAIAQERALDGLPRICRELGKLYKKRNDFERAEENLKLAVEMSSPPSPENSYTLGKFYLDRGRYEEARQIFEALLPLAPRTYSPLHLDLGRLYDHLGQPEQARQEYQVYLKIAPRTDPDRDEVLRRLTRR